MRRVLYVEQDIRWLDVVMNDSLFVRIINGGTNACKEIHNLGDRREHSHMRGTLDTLHERGLPLDVVHDYIRGGLVAGLRWTGNIGLAYLHNVGMVQCRYALPFFHEEGNEIGVILKQIGMKHFHGNILPGLSINTFPDLARAPVSKQFLQLVFSKASWGCVHGSFP